MSDSPPIQAPLALPTPGASWHTPADLWRSIYFFNLYRLAVAGFLLLLTGMLGDAIALGERDPRLFLRTAVIYAVLALLLQVAISLRKPRFNVQLAMQMATDIVCVTLLAHTSGGIQSNLGILLLVSLAGAGMISRGRITLFYAALASIAVLLQHAYVVLTQEATLGQFLQVGLLSVAYFVVAWMAHTLAKYAVASEKLATLRGVDLANMAEANRLMIQDMPDGVLVVDERGVLRQGNPSAQRLMGLALPLTSDATLESCSPALARQFVAWREQPERGAQLLRLPGTHHLVRVRFLPVQREGLWGAVVFLEDMQRIQAQAQQIKLAALGRLTANIAHEVRNPLSSISYAVELLQEDGQNAQQSRLLRIILDNSERINRIVQGVMQLNQRDRVHTETQALAQVLHTSIVSLCQSERVALEIFQVEASADCMINFDRGHLEQVLWNLCGNALRYCSKQAASVRLLATRAEGGETVVEISDDGPGVTADSVQQLFEPFYTTSTGGTGLGLYIARELCEANSAVLEYVPRAGGGACFRIVFGATYEH